MPNSVNDPIPHVVVEQGSAGDAPGNAVPIALYGATGGGGGGGAVNSVNGDTGDVAVTLDSLVPEGGASIHGETKSITIADTGDSIVTTINQYGMVSDNQLIATAVTPEEINFRNIAGQYVHITSPESLSGQDVYVNLPSSPGVLALEGSVTLDSLVQPGGSTVNGTNKYVNFADDVGNIDTYSTISYENVTLQKLSDSASVTLTAGGVTALNQSLSTNIVGSEVSVENFDAGSQTSITAGTVSLDDGQGNRGTITTPATGGTLSYALPAVAGTLAVAQGAGIGLWVGDATAYAAVSPKDAGVIYVVTSPTPAIYAGTTQIV